MFNVLLDKGFPTDYKGYELNTDFRVGIQLTLLLEDETFPEDVRLLTALKLLYKDGTPPLEEAIRGMLWFLSCGKSEQRTENEKEENTTDKAIDFSVDSLDIWGAFWSKGIDLTKVNMHWFKFITALGYIDKDCPLAQKMSYRTTDLSKLKGDTKKFYAELKEKYRIKPVYTPEEYEELMKQKEKQHGSYYMKLLRTQLGQ